MAGIFFLFLIMSAIADVIRYRHLLWFFFPCIGRTGV